MFVTFATTFTILVKTKLLADKYIKKKKKNPNVSQRSDDFLQDDGVVEQEHYLDKTLKLEKVSETVLTVSSRTSLRRPLRLL